MSQSARSRIDQHVKTLGGSEVIKKLFEDNRRKTAREPLLDHV